MPHHILESFALMPPLSTCTAPPILHKFHGNVTWAFTIIDNRPTLCPNGNLMAMTRLRLVRLSLYETLSLSMLILFFSLVTQVIYMLSQWLVDQESLQKIVQNMLCDVMNRLFKKMMMTVAESKFWYLLFVLACKVRWGFIKQKLKIIKSCRK